MSKKIIGLKQFDAAIVFREEKKLELIIPDGNAEDLIPSNIELALTLYDLLVSWDPKLLEFLTEERKKTKKKIKENYEKPKPQIH